MAMAIMMLMLMVMVMVIAFWCCGFVLILIPNLLFLEAPNSPRLSLRKRRKRREWEAGADGGGKWVGVFCGVFAGTRGLIFGFPGGELR